MPQHAAMKGVNGSLPWRKPHCYSASFGEQLVRREIAAHSAEGDTILDPFMGSATTLIEARLAGRKAIGVDVDPVANLIGTVLTSPYDRACLFELEEWVAQKAMALENPPTVAELTKEPWLPGETREIEQLPATIPDNSRIQYWFSPTQSAALAALTAWIPASPSKTRDVLRLGISAAIVRKWPNTISRAKDIDHSRPHRVDRPGETLADQLRVFRHSFKMVIAYVKRLNEVAPVGDDAARSIAIQSDSVTYLKTLPIGFVDYVLTSPPYFDAIDYPRAHKFSQWWLWPSGTLRHVDYVGLKPSGRPDENMLERWRGLLPKEVLNKIRPLENSSKALAHRFYRYAEDLDELIAELYRVAKVSGTVTIVIGNNVIKRNQAPVVDVVTALFERHGFSDVTIQDRDIDPSKRRYPYGIKGFQGLMRKEYVIHAAK